MLDVGEESLDIGPRSRPPGWARRVASGVDTWFRSVHGTVTAVLLAVLLTAVVVHAADGVGNSSPTARPVTTSAAPDTANVTEVRALATAPQLLNYVRAAGAADACPVVTVRDAPQRAIISAVRLWLPRFTVRDFGRTLDESTALCILQARAYDTSGTVLVVAIGAPSSRSAKSSHQQLSAAAQVEGARALESVTTQTSTGWTVTVGSVGSLRDEPDSSALTRMAQDPTLLWNRGGARR